MTEEPGQDLSKQKNRSRKKQLYSMILKQMEFYFSSANLSKDRWTSKQLQRNESIPLEDFLKFNRIRALTNDVQDLVKALRSSELLLVTDDLRVKLSVPVNRKENADDCIIYVEQVPPDAEHEWLKEIFSCYGSVDYVSIPKFHHSNKCKGFAFVEFSKPETAQMAIEDYKKAGRYLPTTEIEPYELLSICTFKETDVPKNNKIIGEENNTSQTAKLDNKKKRKLRDSIENGDKEGKKIKFEEESHTQFNINTDNAEKFDLGETLKDESTLLDNSGNVEMEEIENTDESKKKKNRKKKKKNKKAKPTPDTTGFQILSKEDWKRLRNKYLNTQKDKLKLLKKHLSQTQMKSDNAKQKVTSNKEFDPENKATLTTLPKEFISGLIVKITVLEPITDIKQFKSEVRDVSNEVKYTDLKEGCTSIYVRLSSPKAAQEFCEKSVWPEVEILTGIEEKEYWEVIKKDRHEKLNKAKVKERGKDKLLKKSERVLGQHIIFDDI